MKSLPLLLIAGSLALFAAGCGGDDDDGNGGDNGATAARGYDETGQAVDDICKRAEAEADPIAKKATGDAAKDAEVLKELTEVNEKYIAEVKKIVPDAKLKATFDDFVSTLDQMQAKTIEAANAAEAGDQKAYQAAAGEVGELDKENDRLAIALGAPDCATD